MLFNILLAVASIIFWPHILNLLIPIGLLWLGWSWLYENYGRKFGKYIPTPVDDKKLGRAAYHAAWGKQYERRGTLFSIWRCLFFAAIFASVALIVHMGQEVMLPLLLWPVIIGLFFLWRWKHKEFPNTRSLAGRRRR